MNKVETKMVASVGDAEMIASPIIEGGGRGDRDHIQYRINEQIVQRDTYFAYVLTLIAGAMTNGVPTIGKPVKTGDEE
jgi:hypothetical protein